jgi:hypothetical protein
MSRFLALSYMAVTITSALHGEGEERLHIEPGMRRSPESRPEWKNKPLRRECFRGMRSGMGKAARLAVTHRRHEKENVL